MRMCNWKNITALTLSVIAGLLLSSCSQESVVAETAESEQIKNYGNIHDVFSTYDNDGNGYLDQQEFFQLQNDPFIIKSRQKIPEMQRSPLIFEEIDENGDNQLSLEELTATIFPILPINGNGKVHGEESTK